MSFWKKLDKVGKQAADVAEKAAKITADVVTDANTLNDLILAAEALSSTAAEISLLVKPFSREKKDHTEQNPS